MAQPTLSLEPGPTFRCVDFTGRVEHFDDGYLVAVTYQKPSRVQPGWSCAAADEPPSIHHLSDDALDRLAVSYRRKIEDGHPAEPALRVVDALRRVRRRLRMRYGARDAYGPPDDRGTDVRHEVEAHGEPPSYALAFTIDRERFDAGKPSVVAWSTAQETGR